jgi:two-component system, cell cycle sensor histidine kinase PleC
MSAPPIADESIPHVSLRETLALRQLETAARYLYVNLWPAPFVAIGMAAILSGWFAVLPLAVWAGATIVTQSVLAALLHRFLQGEAHVAHRGKWTALLGAALFVSSCAFAGVALLFWVDNDRLNNVLLYAFVAAGLASAGGESAPSPALTVANLAPYGLIFASLPLIHERFPLSLGFAGLACIYVCIVVIYAKSVRQLAREMLLLREEKRALIVRLQDALADATAARRRAETASRAKSQFLANMSHELRTPLNAVLGFSEVIRDRLFGDDAIGRYSDYAGAIHTSGGYLLGLINDVLDLSKIEAGKLELACERFDLVRDADEALRFVEPQALRKNIQLVRDMPGELDILADKRALRQIAVNLLSNAVKFTPADGTVTLVLRRLADGSVSLAVSDTGIGIRPDDMQRVLESFGQGRHDILPTEDHGTGLGLAIAKSLAEAHSGTIKIDSALGEGTTVTVTLPQAPQDKTLAA